MICTHIQVNFTMYNFHDWLARTAPTSNPFQLKTYRLFHFTQDGLRVSTASNLPFTDRVYRLLRSAPRGRPAVLAQVPENGDISTKIAAKIRSAATPTTPLTEWLLGGPPTAAQQQVRACVWCDTPERKFHPTHTYGG